jgi:hypothetical protein
MFRKSVVCFPVLLALSVPAYPAVVQTYNSRSTFEAALIGSSTLIDFSTFTNMQDLSAGFNILGAGFANVGGESSWDMYTVNNAGSPYNWGTGTILTIPAGVNGAYLEITLSSAATALGFNVMTVWPSTGGTVQYSFPELAIGPTDLVTSVYPNPLWFGLSSDTAFTKVRIYSNTGGRAAIDNLEFGNVQQQQQQPEETAEIATLLMIGTGLLALRLGCGRLRSFAR